MTSGYMAALFIFIDRMLFMAPALDSALRPSHSTRFLSASRKGGA